MGDEKITWDYRCSICGGLVAVGRVAEHQDWERARPTWPGYMSLERVDRGEG